MMCQLKTKIVKVDENKKTRLNYILSTRKIYHTTRKINNAGIVILISNEIELKVRKFIR